MYSPFISRGSVCVEQISDGISSNICNTPISSSTNQSCSGCGQNIAEVSILDEVLLPGSQIINLNNGKSYNIVALVGRGVYEAIRKSDNEHVAIKEGREPKQPITSLTYNVLQSILHDTFPKVYEIFQTDGDREILVTEYVKGVTLAEIGKTGILKWETVSHIAFQLFEALIYLHNIGIIHRDIKPENIIIDPIIGKVSII